MAINGTLDGKWEAIADWLVRLVLLFVSVIATAIWVQLQAVNRRFIDIDRRLVAIESNRFTSRDGLDLWREVEGKVDRDELLARIDRLEDLIQEHR